MQIVTHSKLVMCVCVCLSLPSQTPHTTQTPRNKIKSIHSSSREQVCFFKIGTIHLVINAISKQFLTPSLLQKVSRLIMMAKTPSPLFAELLKVFFLVSIVSNLQMICLICYPLKTRRIHYEAVFFYNAFQIDTGKTV